MWRSWRKENDVLVPIKTDKVNTIKIVKLPYVIKTYFTLLFNCCSFIQEPAPAHILNIRCNCSTTTSSSCGKLCQCRRHGITCMTTCGQCHGQECTNSMSKDDVGDDTEDEHTSDEEYGNIFENLFDF